MSHRANKHKRARKRRGCTMFIIRKKARIQNTADIHNYFGPPWTSLDIDRTSRGKASGARRGVGEDEDLQLEDFEDFEQLC